MRGVLRGLVVVSALMPFLALAAQQKILVELNSVENADNRCRLNFVIEKKSNVGLESSISLPSAPTAASSAG